MPAWNDEDFYYNQLKSVLQYGHPLGYYGYDGSHAPIGNFGAHGWFILLPYVVFSKIFGLHFNTIAVVNLLLMTILIIVYEFLFKPSILKVLFFTTILSAPMCVFYSNTAMMEGENYFYGMLSAVLMAYISDNRKAKMSNYVLGIVILFAMLSKVTWAILIFPYVLILFENKGINILGKWLISVGIMFVGVGGAYSFFKLFAAPYFENSYLLDIYYVKLKELGIGQGLNYVLQDFGKNIQLTFLTYDEKWLDISKNYILTVLIFALMYFIIGSLIKKKKHMFIPVVILGGFLSGVMLLYAAGGYAIRTSFPAAMFAATYIYVRSEDKILFPLCGASLVFLVMTLYVQRCYGFDCRTWYYSKDDELYIQLEQYMSNIEVDDTLGVVPWRNTVAIPLNAYPNRIIELFSPAGIGINYYNEIPQELDEFKANYVLLDESATSDIERLKNNGFSILDQYYNSVLLERR